jgi:phosphoribosylamine--glycine ligase
MASLQCMGAMVLGKTPQRILVIGGGGRENALAWALARCSGVQRVWVAPGNGGTLELPGCEQLAIAESDHDSLLAAAHRHNADLVVIGPEAPLAAGLADTLRNAGLPVFGPGAEGALLEASKQWAKALMAEAAIPTARYWSASNLDEALAVVKAGGRPLVVKADGLAAGKGVTVATTVAETEAALAEVFSGRFGVAGASVVLEEILEGPEVSVFALSDGQRLVLLPPAQDHKRIGEGDTGPNTGGMGAYAPAPLLDASALELVRQLVLEPTLAALQRRGIDYRGVIYAGLMLTEQGPKVIEFNCRFGDPECETLMPLLGDELAAVLLACATGQLDRAPALTIKDGCSACVIAAAEGYPLNARAGDPIRIDLPAADRAGSGAVQLFHAGTRSDDTGQLHTAGGRVLAMVSQAHDFDTAFAQAYDALAAVHFDGITYRRDIGHQVRSR